MAQTHHIMDQDLRYVLDTIVSQETIEYAGFTASKATELWTEWKNFHQNVRPDIGSDSEHWYSDTWLAFLDFITKSTFHPPNLNTTSIDYNQWRYVMDTYGINTATQEAILDPRYTYLRQFVTCAFICKDTVEMRLAAYESFLMGDNTQTTSDSIFFHRLIPPFAPNGFIRLYCPVDMARTGESMDERGVVQSFMYRPVSGWPTQRPPPGMAVLTTTLLSLDIGQARFAAEYARRRGAGCEQVVIGYVNIYEKLYYHTAGAALWELLG